MAMSLISVEEADKIIHSSLLPLGSETIQLADAIGRTLAQDIVTDRDLPPYDRVTMDGIAIRYADFDSGIRRFRVAGVMAAGDEPIEIKAAGDCVEIMTGCSLPASVDTVVRYEDVEIRDGFATVNITNPKQGANIHRRAADRRQGSVVVCKGARVDAAVVSMAASVGCAVLEVVAAPRLAIISTGDEMVPVEAIPNPYQVRRSNSYAIAALLHSMGVRADAFHIADDEAGTLQKVTQCLHDYDVILLSGGVSRGRFDFVPAALQQAGVVQLFHGVKQRPGKPFWLGRQKEQSKVVFAFPGNPVSAFMCTVRYCIPWLVASFAGVARPMFAVLAAPFAFSPDLQYFLQVRLYTVADGRLLATPVEGNGSGDFANLLQADAFMELPANRTNFAEGEAFRVWPYKNYC